MASPKQVCSYERIGGNFEEEASCIAAHDLPLGSGALRGMATEDARAQGLEWNEEELTWIRPTGQTITAELAGSKLAGNEPAGYEPAAPAPVTPAHTRAFAVLLRRQLLDLQRAWAESLPPELPFELTRGADPAVIFAPAADGAGHGNFYPPSWKRIISHPAWLERLDKIHTSKRQGTRLGVRESERHWRELDSGNSSDALLMNIFCSPRVLRPQLCALLGVEPGVEPAFGVSLHVPLQRGLLDASEADMRLGQTCFEAKLTESGFTDAPERKLQRYRDLEMVFHLELLPRTVTGGFQHYQLLRSVMAAFASEQSFCLLYDSRRPDLLDAWQAVVQAVRLPELRWRLRVTTWQELASMVARPLQQFLRIKYGILAEQG